jgi:triosephosphate isomerase
LFSELDGDINHIVERVQESGITPILCIGESKEEYELGLNEAICTLQLSKDLKGLKPEVVSKMVIAYEPVWAIGTGLSATPEIAQGVHFAIRKWLRRTYGDDVAEMVRIQYGGSVTPETVDELMKCPDIDGALVGGASLVAKSFARICMFQ